MPSNPQATAYADRVCARLPVVLERLSKAAGITFHELLERSGLSREMFRLARRGKSQPSIHTLTKLAHGVRKRVTSAAPGRVRTGRPRGEDHDRGACLAVIALRGLRRA